MQCLINTCWNSYLCNCDHAPVLLPCDRHCGQAASLKSTIASDKTRKKRKSKTLVLNFETELMHALPCFFTNNNDKEFVWNGLRISLEHSQNTDMPCRTAMCHKILPSHLNGLIYIPAILNSKTNTGWTAKRTPEWEEKAFRLSTILLWWRR